jgi:transcriptional regulator with XRE-family HTH domain
MSLQSSDDLIAKLHNKKYRDAFVSSRVSNTLALQIRTMRQERGWSQAYLAELLGTSQNAVYRLENPQYGKPSLTTLKRLASIFDVGLAVWFIPFSKLVDRIMNLSTEDILVPSFDADPGFHKKIAASAQVQTTIAMANNPILTRLFPHGTVNQSTIIGSSTTNLGGCDIAVISENNQVPRLDQHVLNTNVRAVFSGNTLSLYIQTLNIDYKGRAKDVGEPVRTAT